MESRKTDRVGSAIAGENPTVTAAKFLLRGVDATASSDGVVLGLIRTAPLRHGSLFRCRRGQRADVYRPAVHAVPESSDRVSI